MVNQPLLFFFILNKGMIFFVDDLITSVFIRPFDDKEILLCLFFFVVCFSLLFCFFVGFYVVEHKLFGIIFVIFVNWTVFFFRAVKKKKKHLLSDNYEKLNTVFKVLRKSD